MSCTGCQYHQTTGLSSSRCTYTGPGFCVKSATTATPRKKINKNRKTSVYVGLSVLTQHAQYGQTMTCEDIAEVCGCSKALIQEIERKALAKYKHLMRHYLGDLAIELELQD